MKERERLSRWRDGDAERMALNWRKFMVSQVKGRAVPWGLLFRRKAQGTGRARVAEEYLESREAHVQKDFSLNFTQGQR